MKFPAKIIKDKKEIQKVVEWWKEIIDQIEFSEMSPYKDGRTKIEIAASIHIDEINKTIDACRPVADELAEALEKMLKIERYNLSNQDALKWLEADEILQSYRSSTGKGE